MNGKTATLLRKLANEEGVAIRSVKKNYSRMNRHQRASVKATIKARVAANRQARRTM